MGEGGASGPHNWAPPALGPQEAVSAAMSARQAGGAISLPPQLLRAPASVAGVTVNVNVGIGIDLVENVVLQQHRQGGVTVSEGQCLGTPGSLCKFAPQASQPAS